MAPPTTGLEAPKNCRRKPGRAPAERRNTIGTDTLLAWAGCRWTRVDGVECFFRPRYSVAGSFCPPTSAWQTGLVWLHYGALRNMGVPTAGKHGSAERHGPGQHRDNGQYPVSGGRRYSIVHRGGGTGCHHTDTQLRTPQPPTPMGRLMDANPTMANTGMAGPPSCTITTRYNTSSEPRLAAAVNHTTSAMRSVILRIPKTLNPSAPTATAPVTAANGTDTGASATVAVVNSSAVALSRSAPTAASGDHHLRSPVLRYTATLAKSPPSPPGKIILSRLDE